MYFHSKSAIILKYWLHFHGGGPFDSEGNNRYLIRLCLSKLFWFMMIKESDWLNKIQNYLENQKNQSEKYNYTFN